MKLICLVGATASGKDSLLASVVKETEVTPIISTTSRPIRNCEVDGREYNFVTNEEMRKMLNEDKFIEVRAYNVKPMETWYYGITKESIDLNSNNTYIGIVDIEGLAKIRGYLKENNIEDSLISIFVNCSARTRLKRALEREEDMTDEQIKEVCRRNISDMDFVVKYKNECMFLLNNENVNDFNNNKSFIKSIIEKLN